MNYFEKIKIIDKRTLNTWKHILFSFLFKGFNIAINFLLVPLAIGYLGAEEYGIWVTLSSVFIWIGYLDIGLGNGMRNKLTEAISNDDKEEASKIVSTTYFIIILLFFSIILLFNIISPFVNWYKIFNTSIELEKELSAVCLLIGSLFCIQFIVKLIGNILLALQLAAWNNVIIPISNFIIMLLFMFLLKNNGDQSHLYNTALLYSLLPIIVYFVASFVFFSNKKYKYLSPKFKNFSKNYIKEVIGIGILFFIIQISAVMMQSTTNLLISHLFSSIQVTNYDVSFKLINTVRMLFFIIMVPYWSAVTDAYVRKDIKWIKNSFKKLMKLALFFIVLVIIITSISQMIFKVWIGEYIIIPMNIVIAVSIFVSGFIISETTIQFLNGMGKIKLQAILSVIVVIINIPIAIFLSRTSLGIVGVIIAPLICRGIKFIFGYIQYNKIVNERANGIWNE